MLLPARDILKSLLAHALAVTCQVVMHQLFTSSAASHSYLIEHHMRMPCTCMSRASVLNAQGRGSGIKRRQTSRARLSLRLRESEGRALTPCPLFDLRAKWVKPYLSPAGLGAHCKQQQVALTHSQRHAKRCTMMLLLLPPAHVRSCLLCQGFSTVAWMQAGNAGRSFC